MFDGQFKSLWKEYKCILIEIYSNWSWDLKEELGYFNLVWVEEPDCLLNQPHYNKSKELDLLETSRINKGYESNLCVLPRCSPAMESDNSDKMTQPR